MKTIELMLQDHPAADRQRIALYSEALDALNACTEACTVCADACLGETADFDGLRRCLRFDLDCADVCLAAARVLTRQTETPNEIVHAQLHACVVACQACADECARHAGHHEHCRLCAE